MKGATVIVTERLGLAMQKRNSISLPASMSISTGCTAANDTTKAFVLHR